MPLLKTKNLFMNTNNEEVFLFSIHLYLRQ